MSHPTTTHRSASSARRHPALRGVVYALSLLVALQPLAASAAGLAQSPLFAVSALPANVMLMLDDSTSMQGYRLPSPIAGLPPTSGGCPANWVRVKYDVLDDYISAYGPFADGDKIDNSSPAYTAFVAGDTIGRCVPSVDEWRLRNATINPLWYNPAVHYQPWNKDNGVRYPNAQIAGPANVESGPAADRTERDVRTWPDGVAILAGNGSIGDGGGNSIEIFRAMPPGYVRYPAMPWEPDRGADLFTNRAPTENTSLVCPEALVPDPDVWVNTCDVAWVNPPCDQWRRENCSGVNEFFVFDPGSHQCPDPTSETGFRTEGVSCSNDPPRFCPGTITPVLQSPGTFSCPVARVPQGNGTWRDWLTPAHYYRFEGVAGEENDPSKYRIVEIDRKKGWTGGVPNRDYTNLANRYPVIKPDGTPGDRRNLTALVPGDLLLGQCWGNGGDGTWCTFEEEAQNYANWFLYYRNRLFAGTGVASEVLADLDGPGQYLRLGYGRINYFPQSVKPWNARAISPTREPAALPDIDGQPNPGHIERGVRPFLLASPERQQVFDWLFTLNWNGSTPNREAIDAIGRYYTREDSLGPWGDNPGVGGGRAPADHLWCRRNFSLLATDGEWTKILTGFAPPAQPRVEEFVDKDPLGLGNGNVETADGVDGPVISGFDFDTGAARADYQYVAGGPNEQAWASNNADAGTLTDVVMYYWNRDLRPPTATTPLGLKNALREAGRNKAFWQHMATYIVGYGVSASMEAPPLTTRADIAAGTPEADPAVPYPAAPAWPAVNLANNVITGGERINDTLRAALIARGNFYSASDPQALRIALSSAFTEILANDSAGTAVAVTSPVITAGGIAVQSSFTTDTWVGDIFAYDSVAMINWLRHGMPKPLPVWSGNFPAWDSRNIVTSKAWLGPAVDFLYGNLTPAQQADLNNDAGLFNYLRGDQSSEPARRARTTLLGDIVNSGPLLSKALDQAYQAGPAASIGIAPDEYRTHVANKKAGRAMTAMVGANDGMFHIFDARPASATKGQELFAYVPRSVYPILKDLADPGYLHKYYVDGPVIEGDVSTGGAWKTVVVASTGAGPKGLFAFDVTDPTAMGPANVLWDMTVADEPDLGHVLGTGVIGSIKDETGTNGEGRWVALVPNGYESANYRAVLLVIDVLTGLVIKKIDTGVGDIGNQNGLGPLTPVYDGSRNIVAVYAGDKLGNLWKFDFSKKTLADWEIYNEDLGVPVPLFVAKDEQGIPVPQPISTPPRITVHPRGGLYVTFGTGKLFETGDAADVQLQTFYALRDTGGKPPIKKTDLQKLRIDRVDASGAIDPNGQFRKVRAGDVNGINWNTQDGWFINLKEEGKPAQGERVIAPPILDAGFLSVTSYVATTAGDPCRPGADSYLYRLDLANGFQRGSFIGVSDTLVVGNLIETGTVGGLAPVYEPLTAGGPVVDTMDETDVPVALASPKYKMSGSQAIQQGATGTCTHIGLRVDGSMAAVPTQCAGVMPLRVWRPIR